MYFKKLKIQNFMSFQDEEISDFSPSLVLVSGVNHDEGGANGSGKSSIWDACSWVLFNQTIRGLKNDEVIHRKFKKDCAVLLEFEHNKKNYLVRRYRKHFDYGSKLLIDDLDEGTIIEKGTVADTQDYLLSLLGIDFDLFRCTIMFGQDDSFNFVDATNKNQKEILSKVMRIDFDTCRNKAFDRSKEINIEIQETEKKIAVLESHRVNDVSKLYEQEIEEWQSNQKNRIKNKNDEIKNMDAEIQSNLEFLKDEGKKRQALQILKDAIEKIKGEKEDLTNSLHKIETKKYHLSRVLDQITVLESECPTCLQSVDREKLQIKIDETKKFVSDLSGIESKVKDKLNSAAEKYNSYDSKADSLELDIRALEGVKKTIQDISNYKKRAEEEIESIKVEANPYLKLREDATQKQNQIAQKIEELQSSLEVLKKDISYVLFWKEAFGDSGIKSFIFDLICGTLTARSSYYSNILTNGSIMVEFSTQAKLKTGEYREKFEAMVVMNGEKVPYAAYSGGEKRRISLAVDMALSDVMRDYWNSDFNLLVFDEQTNGMDSDGRQSFLNLLKELSKNKFVAVVDHDLEFKSKFDKVWQVEKCAGISQIKKGDELERGRFQYGN